ncbi:MAG: hypothetical protein ABL966_16085, partial [Acidimicrobiales bacterium]
MTAVLAVLVAVLAATGVLGLIGQQRLGRRIVHAAQRLSDDIPPSGSGLAEATSVLERAVDRMLLRGGEGTVAEA